MRHIEAGQRFWGNVNMLGDCWIWTSGISHWGYGLCASRRRSGGHSEFAHRVAYELSLGESIPNGMELDHKCRNRACVNPAHLRLATRKQNAENIVARRGSGSGVRGVYWDNVAHRWRASVCHNGHRYYVGIFADLNVAKEAVRIKRLELFTHNEADRVVAE